jgi:hypothetical protein
MLIRLQTKRGQELEQLRADVARLKAEVDMLISERLVRRFRASRIAQQRLGERLTEIAQ